MKKITLKSQQQRALTLAAAIPVLVLLAGCDQKAKPPVNGEPVANRAKVVAPADANNSAVNVRDRNNATLTPIDQGNSEGDLEITQKIRKALVGGTTDYSITAQNIKIITVNGKVTLRGPVNTAAEKAGIATLANSVAGAGNVDNQLEVKTNK